MIKKYSTLIKEFSKSVVVGGIASLVDYIIFICCRKIFFIKIVASNVIAFIFGLVVNFILTKFWVFKKSAVKNLNVEFIIFSLIGIVGLVINSIALVLLVEKFYIAEEISKIIAIGISFVWNFLARKLIIYREE